MSIDYSKFKIEQGVDWAKETQQQPTITTTPNGTVSSDPEEEEEVTDSDDEGSGDQAGSDFNASVYTALLGNVASRFNIEIPEDLELKDSMDFEDKLENLIINKRVDAKNEERFKSAPPQVKLFLGLKEYYDDDVKAMSIAGAKTELENMTDEDIADEDVQKNLYRDYLGTVKKMAKEDIDEQIATSVALGKLKEKAVSAKTGLIDYVNNEISLMKESAKTRDAEAVRKETERIEAIIDRFSNVEEINGVKINEKLLNQMKTNLTKVVKVENNKSYNDFALKQKSSPEEMTFAIEFMNTLGIFNMVNGKWTPDFSKLTPMVQKKIKSKLDDVIMENQRAGTLASSGNSEVKETILKLGYNTNQ